MTDPATCLIDDFGPLPVARPASVGELGEAVRRAAADGQAVYPLGGRTSLGLGLPPTRPGVAVDLTGLAEVVDYPARDMTVTVQAGITLARLQALLAPENQRLPVDVPMADRATLGGAVAANVSGPRRLGFGTLRDYVLGITVVNDEGQETKAGGRVVKNVAGYDLCKLYTGSLGTLGVITQVTLKLRPRPDEHALLLLECRPGEVGPRLEQLHASATRPVCVDLLNQEAARYMNRQGQVALPDSPWLLAVGFEDNRTAVTWQVQQLVKELHAGCALEARIGQSAQPLWHALAELPACADAAVTFKANLLPGAVAAFCREAEALSGGPLLLQAHAGSGIVVGHLPGEPGRDQVRGLLEALLRPAREASGNVVVQRCPAAWKATLPVWGVPRGDAWLMRAVKERLDPRRLFNPGRFVDGI